MLVHAVFDLLAWLAAAGIGLWVRRRRWLARASPLSLRRNPGYVIALNLFHLLCIALVAYSALMLRQTHELRPAG